MAQTDRPITEHLRAINYSGARAILFSLLFLGLDAAPVQDAAESGLAGDPRVVELFEAPAVRQISIRIRTEEMQRLRANRRQYVEAEVREGGQSYSTVGIRVKGSTGSFRSLDDKPSFTLSFDQFDRGARFHGLRKIHLNNSVEDPSYLNEMIGSELFRMAGLPAPRVTHARIELNGRLLGLYVLKEGFTEALAGRYFSRADGSWSEDDPELAVDSSSRGFAVRDGGEKTGGWRQNWQGLEADFDLDQFIRFMAMEIMVCHRDGYCLARNNFRVYHDPETGRKFFFPHGMDQLFGKSDLPWRPNLFGNVARAVMETAEGRERYRHHFVALYTDLFVLPRLTNRVNQIVAGLKPFLTGSERARVEIESVAVQDRIVRRTEFLGRQLAEPDPLPIKFVDGVARLNHWVKVDAPRDGSLDETIASDGVQSLAIQAGSVTSASWRTIARLERGRYRFEGAARAEGYTPLPFGRNQGAALRVAGNSKRSSQVTQEAAWAGLEIGFDVQRADEDVELVCEFRASSGRVWFDRSTLRLVRIE